MPRKLKWLLFATSFCLQTSCAPNPPDVPVFENLQQRLSTDPKSGHLILTASPTCMAQIEEAECGHGVFIMSGKEIFVGEKPANFYHGKPWSLLKQQSVYVPSVESYAPISTYIINSCNKMGCNDQVDKFRIKLNSVNGIWSLLGGS